jgi:predicted O-methyltransferase YrrM
MNPILAEMLQSQQATTATGETVPLHSHLPELEGAILQSWLRAYQPRRLLEIGLAYGSSSLCICEATAGWSLSHYHIIDAFQTSAWQNIGRSNLERAGYGGRFHLHEELSELCLPRLLQEGLRFDFAFVDGWHTFDHVLLEFFYINRMLDVGGLIIFDDLHLPSLQKVMAYLERYPCYERLELPPTLAHAAPIKVRKLMKLPLSRIGGFVKRAADERAWSWFQDF